MVTMVPIDWFGRPRPSIRCWPAVHPPPVEAEEEEASEPPEVLPVPFVVEAEPEAAEPAPFAVEAEPVPLLLLPVLVDVPLVVVRSWLAQHAPGLVQFVPDVTGAISRASRQYDRAIQLPLAGIICPLVL